MTGKRTGNHSAATRTSPLRPRAFAVSPARGAVFYARAPSRIYAKTVGSFVPGLTRKAFEKYGFSAATLLTDWAQIAGAELAHYTVPERLKWPRGADAYGKVEEGAEGRRGATLVLRVDPARALDVEYKSRQIVERINAYFGYRAVAALRLIQAPVEIPLPPGKAQPPLAAPASEAPGASDPLERALARLGAAVLGERAART